jgi:predicted nucleotide-binding protein (sugar kinase/HSP70/actin superfamily)
MRDNPPANGFIVRRLEALGAEVLVTPIREWINYSSYRYRRDSLWERSPKGLLQSLMQLLFQGRIEENLVQRVRGSARLDRDIHVDRMLELCERYITRHYDGQPALVLGSTSGQVDTGIHGVVNVMPFTCMPETFTTAVTPLFRKDHGNIPWVNIAYDGQDDPGIDIRLQAFMHQVREYARR